MNLGSSSPKLSFFHSVLKSCIDSNKSTSTALAAFRHLLRSSVKPNDFTFSVLLKASASSLFFTKLGVNQIQTHLVKLGIDQFAYVSTSLLDVYMKLGCNISAHKLFDDMPSRDTVAWNALICGYSRNGCDIVALELFVRMRKYGFSPCKTTLVSVIPSCRQRDLVFQGMCIHGFAIKTSLDFNSQVKNVLISMYAKCSELEAAEILFNHMVDDSVVSWNTMIGAYGQNGFYDKAMLVFRQMQEGGVDVNSVTIVSLLSANANPESTHGLIIKIGFINDASVITSLICVYAKMGETESAEEIYDSLPEESLISLTAITSSYAEKGSMSLVMKYFAKIQHLDMKLDAVSIVSILQGITDPDHMETGLAFHGYARKLGLCSDSLVANGLISMYSKFTDIDAVLSVFCEIDYKPLITWNSVISSCIHDGKARDAIELFRQMQSSHLKPDAITIASLLSGCPQLGDIKFGRRLHCYTLRNNLEGEDFVSTALIDTYTKCGSIEQGERVFRSIKYPCLASWNAMILGYSLSGFEERALVCYSEMQKHGPKPDGITLLGVLAACIHGNLVDEGRKYFKTMTKEYGIKPTLQHCAYMVGLLGRAGLFEEAILFTRNMEMKPDSAVWGALLSGCFFHQEVKLGECLCRKLYFLDYRNGGFYVLMSNLYAVKGMWKDVARVRELVKDIGADGCSGVSLIEATSIEEICYR